LRRKLELLLGATLAALAAHAPAARAGAAANPPTDPYSRLARPAPGAAPRAAFAPPATPMVLTRELRRTLGDGQEVVSRRSYAVRFVPEGQGWTVEGEVVSSEVEAPPSVPAAIVALERGRSDDGLFPLRLDGEGLIVAQQGSSDPASAERALAVVRARLADAGLSPADRAAAVAMAEQLQRQSRSAGGNWPVDLFRPANGERSEVRTVPLGNGAEGRVTVTTAAATASSRTGLVDRFERKVLTETGGTSRLSVETWTLRRLR
jgi:hypothetical protein